MKLGKYFAALLGVALMGYSFSAPAEQHRATRLGNPATRFAPPLKTPEDLRARFRDPKLRPDFAAVLEQWGWTGDINDMFHAAATNEISDIEIPLGSTMPFMSTRENGKPICLRNVLWAGDAPAPAYAFNFTSKGRLYRCVTPKACSNFFLEDVPQPALTLKCEAPEKVPAGRGVNLCLTVINTGTETEPLTKVMLEVPAGTVVASRSDRATLSGTTLTWQIPELAPNKGKQVCAEFKLAQPGLLPFASYATGTRAAATPTNACQTEIVGIAAVLLEVVDAEDPIEVGHEVTYTIKVTNQGTSPGTNIRLVCNLPESQEFVASTGETGAKAEGRSVVLDPLVSLAPKAAATWTVVAKALTADDARFKVELRSDQFAQPITEDESTQLY